MTAKKYRPDSDAEAEFFNYLFCSRCKNGGHFKVGEEEYPLCNIMANAIAHGIDQEGYPDELIFGFGGPICTAFDHAEESQ